MIAEIVISDIQNFTNEMYRISHPEKTQDA